MAVIELLFVSRSANKTAELRQILAPHEIGIVPFVRDIPEIQTEDLQELVRRKALAAFDEARRPLLVEHTGLYLDHLNGLPGGLTAIFWDRLKEDRFCELFGNTASPGLTARTMVGYVDGRRIHFFQGEMRGRVAPAPAGDQGFQWDRVVIPEAYDQTISQLGPEIKNRISMRRRAMEGLVEHLVAEEER
jgi:XTP/dITP diphosphohydrolase